MDQVKTGKLIRQLRTQMGLTQKELAGQLYGKWKSKNNTGRDFMRRMDMSANTFYRRVREYEEEHGIA